VVLVVAVIDAFADVAGKIEAVALVAANICPRRSPIDATETVATVTVVSAAVSVCVSVIVAAVNGVNA
jgi:hypothetical protein